MSTYFSYLPDVYVRLDSFYKQGVDPYIQAKNIFRRIKIRDDLTGAVLGFQQYSIGSNERPDETANKAYGDPQLDWVVLLANNIINIYNEWPMHEDELMRYVDRKYGTEAGGIHHYETLEITDSRGTVLVPEGVEVNFNYQYTDSQGVIRPISECVRPVSNYDYEIQQNDYKRNIYLLKPQYLSNFIAEFTELVEYLPNEELNEETIKKTFDVLDENYIKNRDTYSTDIGRVAVTKTVPQQDFADRTFAKTAGSAAVIFAVQEAVSNTVNASGVIAGTQDSSTTISQSTQSSSSSSSSGSSSSSSSSGY